MASTPVNGVGGVHPQNKLLSQVAGTALPDRLPSPLPTHLSVPGSGHSTPRIIPQEGSGGSGYESAVFEGKEKHMDAVMDAVEEKGFVPPELVESETKWFYQELGIDDMYFATETVEA